MAFVTTRPIFRNTTVGSGDAGGTSLSDPIDLRDINRQGSFTVAYKVSPSGGAATAATTNFLYYGAPSFNNDPYVIAGTFGTVGDAGGTGFINFTPYNVPFMKIGVIGGTSGTAAIDLLDLYVR